MNKISPDFISRVSSKALFSDCFSKRPQIGFKRLTEVCARVCVSKHVWSFLAFAYCRFLCLKQKLLHQSLSSSEWSFLMPLGRIRGTLVESQTAMMSLTLTSPSHACSAPNASSHSPPLYLHLLPQDTTLNRKVWTGFKLSPAVCMCAVQQFVTNHDEDKGRVKSCSKHGILGGKGEGRMG